jgi:hypothetical protein
MGLGGGRPPIKAAPLRSHLALSVKVSLKSRLCVAVAGTPATRWHARQGFLYFSHSLDVSRRNSNKTEDAHRLRLRALTFTRLEDTVGTGTHTFMGSG